jgi:hypothetical protein
MQTVIAAANADVEMSAPTDATVIVHVRPGVVKLVSAQEAKEMQDQEDQFETDLRFIQTGSRDANIASNDVTDASMDDATKDV